MRDDQLRVVGTLEMVHAAGDDLERIDIEA